MPRLLVDRPNPDGGRIPFPMELQFALNLRGILRHDSSIPVDCPGNVRGLFSHDPLSPKRASTFGLAFF
jgi:hypothetical protein